MGMIFAFIILSIICFVIGFVVSSCISHRKAILTEKKVNEKSYEISMDDLEKFIENYTGKNKPFEDQVMDWLSNINTNTYTCPNLIETADHTIECIADCEGNECPCHPSREDCCDNFNTGECKIIININKLCGIEEYQRNPDLLTHKEAEILANLITQYLNKN